jgi:hypothetical protein
LAPRTLQNASILDRLVSHVTVIDPRHALSGQQFDLVSMHSPRGASFVVIALPDGRRRSIRRSITDLAAASHGEHPGTADETPRVSIRTLLPLAQHLATMITASEPKVIHDGPTLSLEPGARFSDQAAPAPLSAPTDPAVAEPSGRDANADGSASGRACATDAPDAADQGEDRC